MPRITKQGWVMPHGNTKITSGKQAANLITILNPEKIQDLADELGQDVEKIKNLFALDFE